MHPYPRDGHVPKGQARGVPRAGPEREPLPGLLRLPQRRIEPAAPIDKDLYELPPAEYQDIAKLPSSLEAALDALREDHEFLTEGDVFTQDLIDTWLDYKETNEVAPMRAYVHPYEYQMYYDL